MKTRTIAEYMTKTPISIGSDQTVARAHAIMREHRVRHLPVLQAGRIVGLVSERDLAWIESMDETRKETLMVDEAMTPYPYVARPDTPLAEVARTMAAGKFGATLVAEHGQLLGVFTTTDAMRALADSLEPRANGRPSAASPKA